MMLRLANLSHGSCFCTKVGQNTALWGRFRSFLKPSLFGLCSRRCCRLVAAAFGPSTLLGDKGQDTLLGWSLFAMTGVRTSPQLFLGLGKSGRTRAVPVGPLFRHRKVRTGLVLPAKTPQDATVGGRRETIQGEPIVEAAQLPERFFRRHLGCLPVDHRLAPVKGRTKQKTSIDSSMR